MSGYEAWSTTPASNTTVDGAATTDIDENNLPKTLNNAMRAVLANIALMRDLEGCKPVSAGTADAQTMTTSLSLTALQTGIIYGFTAGGGLTNTGAMTMNVDAIGVTSIKTPAGADPGAGAVTAGGCYQLVYDGTNLQLLGA
jgi:hypothetical protein